jgi:hypothetical protein
MTTLTQRGMATAEYTVGTFGAVLIAAVLYKIGLLDSHNPWIEHFKSVVEHALSWHKLSDFIPHLDLGW